MSDKVYQWAKRTYETPDDSDGVTLGEIRLSGRWLWWLAVAAGGLLLFALARLMLGLTVWAGFAEVSVTTAPQWTHTPFSTNSVASSAGAITVVPAMYGQQIIIDYDLRGEKFAKAPGLSAARISVTCLCPSSNWATFSIPEAAKGQFVMPVGASSLYSVDIYQAPQSNGKASIGQYYWGVRQAQ